MRPKKEKTTAVNPRNQKLMNAQFALARRFNTTQWVIATLQNWLARDRMTVADIRQKCRLLLSLPKRNSRQVRTIKETGLEPGPMRRIATYKLRDMLVFLERLDEYKIAAIKEGIRK